jgi:hypothetical protein
MKFVINPHQTSELVGIEVSHQGKCVSFHPIFQDDVVSFITYYLDCIKVEQMSAFGVTEWCITDREGFIVEGMFDSIIDAETKCGEIKQLKPEIKWKAF